MKKKRSDDYLIEKASKIIGNLTSRNNNRLTKLYNYYNGKRDKNQFRHLEENFGIGNPSSIKFIPLIRKHVNFLIGDLLETPVLAKISSKDEDTVSKMALEKHGVIQKAIKDIMIIDFKENVLKFIKGDKINEEEVSKKIDLKVKDIEENFISDYEVASQNVLNYIIQTKLKDQIREDLLRDLLVAGTAFYRAVPTPSGDNLDIEVYSPKDIYFEKDPNSNFVEDCSKIALKRFMSINTILEKYGELLTQSQVDELLEKVDDLKYDTGSSSLIRYNNTDVIGMGQQGTFPVVPDSDESDTYYNRRTNSILVTEVEWIDTIIEDKKPVNYLQRVIKIGKDIWIIYDCEEITSREGDNPRGTRLSFGGVFFMNRHDKPISLVEDCMDLQDKYDIIHFFKDNIIANSGTKGDWIDMSLIPQFLGGETVDRFLKWQAYKKAGYGLIDTSEGGMNQYMNTTFAGYDDTLKADTIQAFQMELESIEATVSSITGVFRERLNGIEQHDAVTNIKVGVKNSFTVTKIYYSQFDNIITNMLHDSMNLAKKVWKDGIRGLLILGDKYKTIFTALPEHFTVSDYDIHVISSSKLLKELEEIKQLTFELIGAQAIDFELAIDAISSKSITDLKRKIKASMAEKREENNEMQQLMQKLQEMDQALKQAEQQYSSLEEEASKMAEENKKIKNAYDERKHEVEMYKAKTDRDYKEGKLKEDARRTEVEIFQLYDGDARNDKVKFLR